MHAFETNDPILQGYSQPWRRVCVVVAILRYRADLFAIFVCLGPGGVSWDLDVCVGFGESGGVFGVAVSVSLLLG